MQWHLAYEGWPTDALWVTCQRRCNAMASSRTYLRGRWSRTKCKSSFSAPLPPHRPPEATVPSTHYLCPILDSPYDLKNLMRFIL